MYKNGDVSNQLTEVDMGWGVSVLGVAVNLLIF
jgi:hypothetical protein